MKKASIHKTEPRQQIKNLDTLPIIDRTLIDYDKYNQFIKQAGVKYSMSLQATRGCPYKCFFCDVYKTFGMYYRRSVEHIFSEVKKLSDIGVKRIEFIDDNFNSNQKKFIAFFKLVLKHKLNLNFFFPSGLRGDDLNKEMIDIMVEAGTIGINVSLEHASPRMQKVMRKNLDVEKLHKNLQYITEKYPWTILTVNAMHGFPTETEEEALMTLDFIKSIHWIDFPYLNNVIIFPGTDLEKFALKSGISKKAISQSADNFFSETPSALPFSQDFTTKIRTIFLREYLLNKNRLSDRLPYQMKQFTEDELNQKYCSYFPTRINSFDDFLKIVRINKAELNPKNCLDENQVKIPNLTNNIRKEFPPVKEKDKKAIKLMLIDLSAYFSSDTYAMEYSLLEPPFGLMALLSYINQTFGNRIKGKIYKPRVDFDSYEKLHNIISDFTPDIIGIRTLTLYKDFFHKTVAYIREQKITTPIIAGGPYATASYEELLQDKNVNLAVIAEGELTLAELIEKMLSNNNRIPNIEVLKTIKGIAFREKETPVIKKEKRKPISNNF